MKSTMKTLSKMNEKPILFRGPMVRAILEGRMTMTRRVIKPWKRISWPVETVQRGYTVTFSYKAANGIWTETMPMVCPYGMPGDRLWVRESWRECGSIQMCDDAITPDGLLAGLDRCRYMADGRWDGPWRPSIYMPRWASRITLEVTAVRVERLNAITAGDAETEGVDASNCCRIEAFERLWDSINAKRGYGWSVNPWVWVIGFQRVG